MADDPEIPTESAAPLAEIEHGPSKFELFLDRNHKKLIVGASILVVAIAGTYLYTEIQQSNQEDAGESLVSALTQDSPANSAVELEKMIAASSGARAATTAELFLAQAKWRAGDQDAAIKVLEGFVAEHPDNSAIGAALLKLASFQMESDKIEAAKETLAKIVSNPSASFAAPQALLTLGDLAASAGDLEAAKNYYEQIRSDYPSSPTAKLAGANLPSIVDDRIALLDIAPATPFTPEPPAPKDKDDASQAPVPPLPPIPTPEEPADPAPDLSHIPGGTSAEEPPAQPGGVEE